MKFPKTQNSNPPYGAWFLLSIFFAISLFMLWPGVMSSDAQTQYAAAKSGFYTDHHPPLMSFLWHHLDRIYPGPAPLFVLHLTMLYLASAIFISIFRESRFKWWYAVYPVLPNILAYTALIVKDTGFTYTYLLSAAILAHLIINNVRKNRFTILSCVVMLLFYGTAVKFQAKFLLIFFTFGISYCATNYKLNRKTVIAAILLYTTIMLAIIGTNTKLVPATQENHSWQFVKAYDLSAISLMLNKPLYPEFIMQHPNFSFGKIRQLFEPREVDLLVFGTDAPIQGGTDSHQRQILRDFWFDTIKQHPWLYLKARANLFSYDLITSPCDRNEPVRFLKTTALAPVLSIQWIATVINAGYRIFKAILRFIWLLPVLFLYLFLGLKNFKNNSFAPPLLMMSLAALALLCVLFFCSMAGTARYVFLCTCMMHASHGFAFKLMRLRKPHAQLQVAYQYGIDSSG